MKQSVEPIILCCAKVDGPLLFADNLTGPCDVCGVTVQFRPHAPQNCILRCMKCMWELIMSDDEITTTSQMIEDAKAYFKRHLS